ACRAACTRGMVAGRDGGSTERDVLGCLKTAKDECNTAKRCFDAPPLIAFNPGPYGTNPKDYAGPFVFPATDGDWDFQKEWTGTDSYVFLIFSPGTLVYQNGYDYSAELFKQSLSSLLSKSPKNVQYFFLPLRSNEPSWPAARDKWVAQLE